MLHPLRVPEAGNQFSIRYAGAGPLYVPDIQALDGCFLACRREVVTTVGFNSSTFDGFHLYDLDFTFHAYRQGYCLAVCRDLALIHDSLGNFDDVWQKYRGRFEAQYHDQFAPGTPGTMYVVGTFASREQLSQVCDPEYLLIAIRWS